MKNDSIPEMLEIADYLKNMKIKTQYFGGYDKENVLEHFEEVNGMYEGLIGRIQEESEQHLNRVNELEEELSESKAAYETRCRELEKQVRSLQSKEDLFGIKEEFVDLCGRVSKNASIALRNLQKSRNGEKRRE